MLKINLILIALCSIITLSYGQQPLQIGWTSTDTFSSFQKTSDGGFIGNTTNITGTNTQVKKYSVDGSVQFALPFPSQQIITTSDGGFVIVVTANSAQSGLTYLGGYDSWIIKINSIGTIIWQKSVSGAGDDYIKDIKVSTNGDVVAIVSSNSVDGFGIGNQGLIDTWLVQITSLGTLSKINLGGSNNETFKNLELLSTTDFLVCISTASNNGVFNIGYKGGIDTWILKVTSGISLTISSRRAYGGYYDDEANLIVSNQKYLLTGYSKSNNGDLSTNKGGKDIWICFLNQDGTLISSTNYGGANDDYVRDAYFNTIDNAFYILCENTSLDGDFPNSNNRTWEDKLLKFTTTGNYVWRRDFFTNRYNSSPSAIRKNLVDSGVLISGTVFGLGSTNLFQDIINSGDPRIFFCKLSSLDAQTEWNKQPGSASRVASLNLVEKNEDGTLLCTNVLRGASSGINRIFALNPLTGREANSIFSSSCSVYLPPYSCLDLIINAKNGLNGTIFMQMGGSNYLKIRKLCPHPYQNISKTFKYYCSTSISDTIRVPDDNEFTYQWKKNGIPILGATSTKYLARDLGKYTVELTGKTCSGKAETDTIVLALNVYGAINPKLRTSSDTLICQNDVVSFSLVDGCSYGYLQWQKNGVDIPGETSLSYSTSQIGVYRVKVTTSGVVTYTNSMQIGWKSTCCLMETVTSGDWENPTTWGCRRVPTSLDNVIINSGHQITVSSPNAVAKNISNMGGTISMATTSCKLVLLGN